jgi:transposase InsO family protein
MLRTASPKHIRARAMLTTRTVPVGTRIGGPKFALIRPNGPWRNLEEVEFATLEWIDWFNNRRLLEPIGNVSPAEFETMYYEASKRPAREVGLN